MECDRAAHFLDFSNGYVRSIEEQECDINFSLSCKYNSTDRKHTSEVQSGKDLHIEMLTSPETYMEFACSQRKLQNNASSGVYSYVCQ